MANSEDRYRRKEDEVKLLILLNERVSTMQKSVETLVNKQGENPCKMHDLRLKYLEKAMWVVITSTTVLVLRIVFNFFSS